MLPQEPVPNRLQMLKGEMKVKLAVRKRRKEEANRIRTPEQRAEHDHAYGGGGQSATQALEDMHLHEWGKRNKVGVWHDKTTKMPESLRLSNNIDRVRQATPTTRPKTWDNQDAPAPSAGRQETFQSAALRRAERMGQ